MAYNSRSPLPENSSPSSPLIEVLTSPSPLPCAELKSLGDDQMESAENISIEALADDETGKLGEMEPERTCLTFKPSLSRAGMRVEAPGQSRLLCREM